MGLGTSSIHPTTYGVQGDAIQACTEQGGIPDCCRSGSAVKPVGPFTLFDGSYFAEAYCSITDASGVSYEQPTPQDTLAIAVEICVATGGVPNCCLAGAVAR